MFRSIRSIGAQRQQGTAGRRYRYRLGLVTAAAGVFAVFILLAPAKTAGAEPAEKGDPKAPPACNGTAGAEQPLARIGNETISMSDVAPDLAFQIYRRRLDEYVLLKRAAEELAEKRLLEREAQRRGIDVDELLRREVDEKTSPASAAEIDAYLEEHPDAARQPGARERIGLYLSEKRRIERRLAFVGALRDRAGFEFLLRPPEQPRVRIDPGEAPARGPEGAPVTLVHFATFNSVRSARSNAYIERLVRQRPGKIREVFVTLPNQRDEIGLAAAELAVAAARQNRFWQLHDRLFKLGGRISSDALRSVAEQLGLEPIPPGSTKHLTEVKRGIELARHIGVEREPVIFVNGRYYSPTFPYEKLLALVDEELGGSPTSSAGE